MGQSTVNVICYADDAVLVAESEDDLQRLLHQFNICAKPYNMEISATKTKSMVIAKNPIRCKLELEGKIIEQVMNFTYLGVKITSDGNLQDEVDTQLMKAYRVAGCLRDFVWNNNHMSLESKIKIYRTCVRPIMTYGIEARADTKSTKRKLRTLEMRILRRSAGFSLYDRQRNDHIRELCKVEDVVKWSKHRRREWNAHVDRMEDNRLAKICRDNKPLGTRPVGRPRMRWAESWFSSSND